MTVIDLAYLCGKFPFLCHILALWRQRQKGHGKHLPTQSVSYMRPLLQPWPLVKPLVYLILLWFLWSIYSFRGLINDYHNFLLSSNKFSQNKDNCTSRCLINNKKMITQTSSEGCSSFSKTFTPTN